MCGYSASTSDPGWLGACGAGGPNVTCPSGAALSGAANPHILVGALVNGPQRPDDSYTDIRTLDNSKVALHYNAGFTGENCRTDDASHCECACACALQLQPGSVHSAGAPILC